MISLLTMLPLYVMGNFHCIGMCGPLVAMIGQHRFRFYYLFGRLVSFTLAGSLAGGSGAVLGAILESYHLGAILSFIFGGVLLVCATQTLLPSFVPAFALGKGWGRMMAPINHLMTPLMLQDRRFPTFLFGFLSLALPCGQTIIVYSACALLEDAALGCLHGFVFALLTSPSLFLAMHFYRFLPRMRHAAERMIALMTLCVALLAFARGFAELGIIPHLNLSERYHVVVY